MKEVRADLKRRARISVGLPPENLPVNAREHLEVTLGYGSSKSRTQLLHARREHHLTILEESKSRSDGGQFLTQMDRLRVREDADHLFRESRVRSSESIGHASRRFAKESIKEYNVRDLEQKWQTKIDAKMPVDPNMVMTNRDRP